MREYYKLKFYINSSHAVRIGTDYGNVHSHCFELGVCLETDKNAISSFNELRGEITEVIMPFNNTLINGIKPFDSLNPTLENLTRYFNEEIKHVAKKNGWIVVSCELSETPTRMYRIDNGKDE